MLGLGMLGLGSWSLGRSGIGRLGFLEVGGCAGRDWKLGSDVDVEKNCATTELQIYVCIGSFRTQVLLSENRIKQRWPSSLITPCCCMRSSKAFRQRPSHQSRYRVDPVSCCSRCSQNTTDSNIGITGAQWYFEKKISRRISFPDRRAQQGDTCYGGTTVLTLFPVHKGLVDCIHSLHLLKGLRALAGILSHKPRCGVISINCCHTHR